MQRRRSARVRPAPARKRPEDSRSTQTLLLVAAGEIFADKGFAGATGKEICERAGTNTAAVNYYFGGMEGLYRAVLIEAHRRLVSLEALSAAVAHKKDAKAKLHAVIELIIGRLTAPVSASWMLRVLVREILAPTAALELLREKEILPKVQILKSIIAEIVKLPEDHPIVARACISVVGPYMMLAIISPRHVRDVLPTIGLGPDQAPAIAHQMLQFALAGLDAIAREA